MAALDILLNILTQMKQVHPSSSFINSLYNHYCNKGGLSKKQLEGLLDKMKKTPAISTGHIATVEAIILKKPVRDKSKPTITAVTNNKDEKTGEMLQQILEKYPQHKRALFLYSRYNKNEALSTAEIDEIKKFHKLLVK